MNYIIFNPDEMRAESLACYGHPVAQTENIDRLATEGTRFDNCFVQHTACTPSRCSFMTGWYPHVRGHRTLWHTLRPEDPNLFRYLKAAGYDVQWWGKNDLLSPDSFANSVSTAGHPGDAGVVRNPFPRDDPRYFSFLQDPLGAPVDNHGDFRCVEGAIEYLRSGPEKPFVVYLPISSPHCPYATFQPWHDMYDPKELPPLRPAETTGKADFYGAIRRSRGLDGLDESTFRKINAVYLGMISYVDYLLGRLLDVLDETGHADDTMVLFFSDHGDWAGDYGLVEKWWSGFDDPLTRVPLLIRAPGSVAGHVVAEQVELFDIMATILESAGIQAEHTHFARSLLPQLGGADGDPNRAVFCEGGYDIHEPHCFEGFENRNDWLSTPTNVYYPKLQLQQQAPKTACRSVMIRTKTHKLVRRSTGAHELYDVPNDPCELTNVYPEPTSAAPVRELESRLLDWFLRTGDVVPWDEDPRGFTENQRA